MLWAKFSYCALLVLNLQMFFQLRKAIAMLFLCREPLLGKIVIKNVAVTI